jgi:hypothetical protein
VWRPLLLLSLVAGCLPLLLADGNCGELVPFTAATYLSKGGSWAGGESTFAHAEGGAKSLVIEHLESELGRVRITYQRAGKTIVETWSGRGIGAIKWADKPPPRFEVVPSKTRVDFGAVAIGRTATESFTVHNESHLQAFPAATLRGAADFALEAGSCRTPNPQQICTVVVTFTPTTTALVSGAVEITAAPAPPATVMLSGRGLAFDGAAAEPRDGEAPDVGPTDAADAAPTDAADGAPTD